MPPIARPRLAALVAVTLTAATAMASLLAPAAHAATTSRAAAAAPQRAMQPWWWHWVHLNHLAQVAAHPLARMAAYQAPSRTGDGDGDEDDPAASAPAAPAPVIHARVIKARAIHAVAAYTGGNGFQACVITRESGGNPQVMNASGHYGLYQFDLSTWESGGGGAATFGHASVAEQNHVFAAVYAARGVQPWAPSDGC